MTVLLLKLHASHSVVARIVLARMVDLNKQKSLFFMELFLYLIFLDLDKIDVYRDKLVSRNLEWIPSSQYLFGREHGDAQ